MQKILEQQAGISAFGRMSDPQAENDFQVSKMPFTQRRLRFICVITAVAYMGAIYADSLQLSGDGFYLLVAGRIFTALTALFPFILTFGKNTVPAMLGLSTGIYMATLMATECLELFLKADSGPLRETPITAFIVLTFYLFQPPQIWQPIVSGGLGSIAYLSILALCTNAPPDYVANTSLTFALANGFGIYYCIRFGAAQRREHLALTELKNKAETDSLTGILNRRRTMELCEREFRTAKRYGHQCSMLLLDIDHFKIINDSTGHAAGDQVLVSIADRCARTLREADVFGRIGGEEFAVFMPHSTMEQTLLAAERIRKTIFDTPFPAGGKELTVTVSIGAATLTPEMDTLEDMFRQADAALYEVKRRGRNGVHGS